MDNEREPTFMESFKELHPAVQVTIVLCITAALIIMFTPGVFT